MGNRIDKVKIEIEVKKKLLPRQWGSFYSLKILELVLDLRTKNRLNLNSTDSVIPREERLWRSQF